jgi:hypothetical protein
MIAKNANIEGTIVATNGSIAGYNIGPGGSYDNAIYKRVTGNGSSLDYEVGLKATSGDTDLAFYVKQSANDWSSSSNVFYVRNDGQLYAENAIIKGEIESSSGKIGGWNIVSHKIYGTTAEGRVAVMQAPSDSITFVFAAGGSSHDSYADCPFRVNRYGTLFAAGAYISGEITATSGDIGGCSIENGVLNVSAANIKSGTIDTARIPNLSADKITAGTINADRIPNISASKITSGTISTDRLSSSVITTENFSSKTLSTSNLTVASGCRLGVASEYNAMIRTVGDYTYIRGFGPDVNYETSFYNLVKYVVQNSSNREIKNDIHDFDDRYDLFFDKLKPQLFKYNFEPTMGYTMGYVWQDAEDARIESGLERNDIGAITETESVVGGLALSKQDFIALNTWQIQKLKARIDELEKKLEGLGI